MADVEERHFEIVSAATVILDRKSKQDIIIIINQVAHMPGTQQFESLFHTDQARNPHLVIMTQQPVISIGMVMLDNNL